MQTFYLDLERNEIIKSYSFQARDFQEAVAISQAFIRGYGTHLAPNSSPLELLNLGVSKTRGRKYEELFG